MLRRWSLPEPSLPLVASLIVLTLVICGRAQEPAATAGYRASAGQQDASPQNAETPPGQNTVKSRADVSLRLGAGDLLEITVYNVPELTTKARVSSDGNVYLPLIDYVHVAGLTIEEAQALIEKRLSDGGFLKNPHVALLVAEFTSQGASMLGEVARPGIYPVLGVQRLFDLISAAGGLTDKAGRSVTITRRDEPDKPITVALARNIADNPESNIEVHPGDTIVVRKADVVYVVGEVGRPSGFLMDSGNLTVLKAIALAGGTTRNAKLSGARIIRKGPAGMTETPVPLKEMLQAKSPDLPLAADDILFVPGSVSKGFATRTFEVALQAVATASIVALP